MAKHRRSRTVPATRRQRAAAPVVATAAPPPITKPETSASRPPAVPATIGWERLDLWIAVGIAALALLLYGWRLNKPTTYVFDEVYHAFTAGQLAAGS